MFEDEYTKYLIYKLIDEPKKKAEEEYWKLNGYPENFLLPVRYPPTDKETLDRLKAALENLALKIPIMEMRNDKIITPEVSQVYLSENGDNRTSVKRRQLRKLPKVIIHTKRLLNLLDSKAVREEFVTTKSGYIFCITLPFTEAIRLLRTSNVILLRNRNAL